MSKVCPAILCIHDPFIGVSVTSHCLSMAAGMCRAHGIAHQRVTERQGLHSALKAAWALNKHSVVEVIVGRDSNVEHHRNIQAAVKAAVLRALYTLTPDTTGRGLKTSFDGSCGMNGSI